LGNRYGLRLIVAACLVKQVFQTPQRGRVLQVERSGSFAVLKEKFFTCKSPRNS